MEWRIPDDRVHCRPLGLAPVLVQQRVPVLDVVQAREDRVTAAVVAVLEHPLDLTDPDRDPGELGGVCVDLDAA